jgi:hypothetical protein
VFFHVNSNPNSYVYHEGIYEGGHHMVAATHPAAGSAGRQFIHAT